MYERDTASWSYFSLFNFAQHGNWWWDIWKAHSEQQEDESLELDITRWKKEEPFEMDSLYKNEVSEETMPAWKHTFVNGYSRSSPRCHRLSGQFNTLDVHEEWLSGLLRVVAA